MEFKIHQYHDPEILEAIRELSAFLKKENLRMQATLDDLIAKVAAQKTVEDSTVALLDGLTAKLNAAIATGDMAKVQAVSDAMDANTAELVAANTANTPAAKA